MAFRGDFMNMLQLLQLLLCFLVFTGFSPFTCNNNTFRMVQEAHALAAGGIKTRSFVFSPKQAQEKPKLVLISGCPGAGKSVSHTLHSYSFIDF